jgi:hypothetical protein
LRIEGVLSVYLSHIGYSQPRVLIVYLK